MANRKRPMDKVNLPLRYGGSMCDSREYKAIMKSVKESIKSGGWQTAEQARLMEEESAKFLGVKCGILTNSGSSAALLVMAALELPKGSEVIISACTFPTVFNVILQNNLIPVVVDAKIGTYNFDISEVKEAITDKTSAIIVVHACGNPVDLRELKKIVPKKIAIILDNCLSGDTKIKTKNGDVLLRDIKVGDDVLTREGFKKVLRHIDRGECEVIKKLGIRGTPEHPFITTKGVKRFDELNPSDILYIWNQKSLSIKEESIKDILNTKEDICEFTIGEGQIKVTGRQLAYIGNFGLTKMAQFLRGLLYTIKTTIHSIIEFLISNSWQNPSIVRCIAPAQKLLDSRYETLKRHEREQNYGMLLQKEENGTVNKVLRGGRRERVYDLEIEGAHEFFANGILVHNCDGFGTEIHGRKVEEYADISFTSFHAAHIVSMGVGGGVYTNDKVLAGRVRQYRDWGRQANTTEPHKVKELPKDYNPRFVYDKIGYNFQILDLQAAMGRVQLRKADKIKKARKKNFDYLVKHLSKHEELIMPDTLEGADVCWFAFPLTTTGDRGNLVAHLEKNGIETRSMFSGQITAHPAYVNSVYRKMKTQEADFILRQSFWVGTHPRMTQADREYIVKTFDDYFKTTIK